MRFIVRSRVGKVVPHAGTWIEITWERIGDAVGMVVPHAGTWIEML